MRKYFHALRCCVPAAAFVAAWNLASEKTGSITEQMKRIWKIIGTGFVAMQCNIFMRGEQLDWAKQCSFDQSGKTQKHDNGKWQLRN